MSNRLQNIKILNTDDNKRYYNRIKYPEIPLTVNDLYIVTTIGDRLDLLADRFYGNTQYWWIISIANMTKIRRDNFALKPGIEIRIPSDLRGILSSFEKLNDNTSQSY